MKLEEEIINEAAKRFSDEIDNEVLFGMLQSIGWTRVILPSLNSREAYVDLAVWLETYCKYPYERKGSDIIFENSKDAEWFMLVWQ
jgi:hypothetical protein